MKSIVTANDIAKETYHLAKSAFCNGTFAVGGILLDQNKVIFNKLYSKEVANEKVIDPTAHGEKQLVDWYYDQLLYGKKWGSPEKLTIVTSLDPCLMCTGCILASGINVVVVALDDFAGINYKGDYSFETFAKELDLLKKTREQFSYFKVVSIAGKEIRKFEGSDKSIFKNDGITEDLLNQNLWVFNCSAKDTRDIINSNQGLSPKDLKDPTKLPDDSMIRKILKKYDPNSLTVRVNGNPRHPDDNVKNLLYKITKKAKERGAKENAAAFIDTFGNVILCLGGMENISPTKTAFMELTRAYAAVRFEAGEEGLEYLPHPKYGMFIFLYGPEKTASSLIDLGAYGSTLEGPIDPEYAATNLQYFETKMPETDLKEWIRRFPPFYSQSVKINPQRV